MSAQVFGLGELAALISAALWAAASLLFASAGARLRAVDMNFLKTAFGFGGLALTALFIEGRAFPQRLQGEDLGFVALSGLIGLTLGDTLYFASLLWLGARRTLVLWALSPAATAWLGALVLGEPITQTFLLGLVLTTLGVGVVLADRSRGPSAAAEGVAKTSLEKIFGLLAGLGAVFCQAGGSVTAKLGGGELSSLELAVVRLAFGSAGLVVVVLVGARPRPTNGEDPSFSALFNLDRRSLFLVVLGTFVGTYLGMWFFMLALQNAYVGVVATLQSTSPVFVLPMVWLFYGERVRVSSLFGAILAVLGVYVLAGL